MIAPAYVARVAGLTYVILILSGIFGVAHVPATLIVWDSAATTIVNIKESEFLFRMGILAQTICFVAFIFLPIFLYILFSGVNKTAAILMVALALVSVPVSLVGVSHHIQVLHLLGDASYLQNIPVNALQTQVMFSLAAFNSCATVTNIFAGLWLFPFGYLVVKSNLLPKLLGILLLLGGAGYLYEFIAGFIVEAGAAPWYVGLVSNLGIFATALWLLVVGARTKKI